MNCKLGVRALLLATLCVTASWAAGPGAKPWVAFGPDGGDARRIASDPRDHAHLYLGTANGWIYESHNNGANWSRLAQVGKRDDLVLDSIVVDAEHPNHLVVGAWVIDRPDGGLYFSWDGGATWTNQAEMRGQSVLSLAASASDPKVLVAGTQRGIFRSEDGGTRWKRISPEDSTEIHNVQSVAIDPQDPSVIYAGTWHLPWKTVDGGEHWDSIKKGIIDDSDVFSIIIDPANPATVFASACSGIYKSENAGLQFDKIKGIVKSARRTRRLLQDPSNPDTVFAGTTEGLYRSTDGGKSFFLTTSPGYVVNDVAIDAADPKHVLIATDRGGVLVSDDGGDSFHPSNGGFSARQVTAIKRDANRPDTLFVGVVNDRDWGGIFQSDNGGQNWIQRSDGLGGRDVFSIGQAPDGTVIAGTAHGLFRLDPLTQGWNRVESAPGLPAQQESVQAILTRPAVPVNPDTAAAPSADQPAPAAAKPPITHPRLTQAQLASQRRAAIRKAVATKRKPAAVPTNSQPFDGSVYSLTTSGQVLLATTSVGLLTSIDNGVTWAATGPAGSADWRFIAAAGKNVIAASLHSAQLSTDSGILWEPVALPEDLTQVYAIAVDKSGTVWVGGHQGVFISSNAGKTWSIPKNLYLNAVNNIFYDDSSDRVVITTAGDSSIVFTVQLPSRQVSFVDTGWSLRFARLLSDHIVAATLFDGIVMQPRMVVTPLAPVAAAQAVVAPATVAAAPTKQD